MSLKVELLLDDFLTIFKMDQTFIKDPLHQTESLIWSHHIPQAFYHYSNHKLNIYGSIRKISHKTSLGSRTLEILVDIFIMKQFFNPAWYS